jgi:predicted transcriptional regulator
MQKTTVYLDADDYRALKRIAARKKRQPAELVREAVAEYAARHEPRRAAKSVGAFASGRRDLSERAEDLLKGMGRSR